MKVSQEKSGLSLFFLFSLWVGLPLFLVFSRISLLGESRWFILGRITGVLGLSLFSFNIFLSTLSQLPFARFKSPLKLYSWHHWIGLLSFIFLAFHPIFLSLNYLSVSVLAVGSFFLPSLSSWQKTLGSLAFSLMFLGLFFTFFLRPRYERWRKIHFSFLSSALFLGSLHSLFIPSPFFSQHVLLKYFLIGESFLALFFVAFVKALKKKAPKMMFNIFEVRSVKKPHELIYEIEMEKKEGSFEGFIPGQFAWFSFQSEGLPKEEHPFSFTSSPLELPKLSIAVKALGDYTRELYKVKPGDKVLVRGPFGEFSFKSSENKKQVWLAGGIGITPFMSMARFLRDTNFEDERDIFLVWSVKEKGEAIFVTELEEISKTFPQNFRFLLWVSSEKGHINFETLKNLDKKLLERDLFVCGPPLMMVAIIRQFQNQGWSDSRIFKERFSL